jgi:hypothetical protein
MARRAGFAAAADGGSVTAGELAVFINRLAGITTGDKPLAVALAHAAHADGVANLAAAAGLCASQAAAAPAVSGAVPPLLRQLDHTFVGAAAMMVGRALATPDALGLPRAAYAGSSFHRVILSLPDCKPRKSKCITDRYRSNPLVWLFKGNNTRVIGEPRLR